MTDRVIGKLRSSSYLRFINWVGTEVGNVECVHIAAFAHPKHGQCEAFVKLYPDGGGLNRGLVNEITAYLFAHSLNLPQPKSAFLAMIPLTHLKGMPPWLRQAATYHPEIPAFCTLRLDGGSAAVRVPQEQLSTVIEDVAGWDDLPHAVALAACEDCGGKVSRKADVCVHCGRPFGTAESAASPVSVVDVRMDFMSMVFFMVKWAIATIPAIILVTIGVFVMGLISGAMMGPRGM